MNAVSSPDERPPSDDDLPEPDFDDLGGRREAERWRSIATQIIGPTPSPPAFLRYYATTDDGPVGRTALEYLRSMLRIGPVRVLTMSGGMTGKWGAYAALLATPISTPFVNVVCCDPDRWIWTQRIHVSTKHSDIATRDHEMEPLVGRIEIYTVGVRNVLLAAEHPSEMEQLTTAFKYQAIAVPTEQLAEPWRKANRDVTVIPVPVIDHEVMRDVILG